MASACSASSRNGQIDCRTVISANLYPGLTPCSSSWTEGNFDSNSVPRINQIHTKGMAHDSLVFLTKSQS